MEIRNTIAETREIIKGWHREGLTVGLVPTMGFLHQGHQSLIRRAAEENDRVVVSIFVNPMQFSESADLDSYPRDLEGDKKKCLEAGADLIFGPDGEEMYGENFTSMVDTAGVTDELCGKNRPGHFRGVCTVVSKLFNITTPDRAYFGQKDAQQLAVIRRMVKDLNFDIEIVGCPIVREEDGLAKSSRNVHLKADERKAAGVLSRSLKLAEDMIRGGENRAEVIIEAMEEMISEEPLARVEYIQIVDGDTIEEIEILRGNVLVALAVRIGNTRLIDNFVIEL